MQNEKQGIPHVLRTIGLTLATVGAPLGLDSSHGFSRRAPANGLKNENEGIPHVLRTIGLTLATVGTPLGLYSSHGFSRRAPANV